MKFNKDIIISKDATITDALQQMDVVKKKLLLVLNNNQTFYSLLSIGDIQRAIINNKPFNTPIKQILRDSVTVAHENDKPEDIINHIRQKRNDFMPVIDDDNNIVKIIYWEDLFDEKQPFAQFDLPVIIMAGGKGTRLKPLTNVIPKPLIPINDKTIIEDIMDRFVAHGSNKFYLSVNYKADMMRYYFETIHNKDYCIEYFQENIPLGTAGSLHLLEEKISGTFFVSNCDIIINHDYSDILKYHKENYNEITLVAAIKNYTIPYGILNTVSDGLLDSIVEKPEMIFKINTGFYILEPSVLNEIPKGQFFHITDLIDKIQKKKRRVGVYPVSEGSWIDIGNWDDYLKSFKYKSI